MEEDLIAVSYHDLKRDVAPCVSEIRMEFLRYFLEDFIRFLFAIILPELLGLIEKKL